MLCVVMLLIDQIIKQFVYINRPQIILIPRWFEITYAENTGTLFGMAQGSNLILIILALIIISLILYIIFKKTKKYSFDRKLWQLILAGGISNIIDRIFRGFVIDYVSLKFFGVCNIADFCIVSGVILLTLNEIRNLKGNKK